MLAKGSGKSCFTTVAQHRVVPRDGVLDDGLREDDAPLATNTVADQLLAVENLNLEIITVGQRKEVLILLLKLSNVFEVDRKGVDIFRIVEKAFSQH